MTTVSYTEDQIPTGSIKTFGYDGIAYVVGKEFSKLSDGDIMVSIELLETGESEKYRLSEILKDPKAV